VYEILLFDFQIAHLAHSLAAAASKCQYISYNVANLAEPWSVRRGRLTCGVYFRAPGCLSQWAAAAVAAYTLPVIQGCPPPAEYITALNRS